MPRAGAFQIASVAGFFQDDFSTCRAIPAAAQKFTAIRPASSRRPEQFCSDTNRLRAQPWEQVTIPKWQWESDENLMSTFGFYPGLIDYWMLSWRGGSIAIMLVIDALIVAA
jgi:hypothetical protein